MPNIPFSVYCDICGAGLCENARVDTSNHARGTALYVKPCEKCKEKEKQEVWMDVTQYSREIGIYIDGFGRITIPGEAKNMRFIDGKIYMLKEEADKRGWLDDPASYYRFIKPIKSRTIKTTIVDDKC